MKRMNDVFRTMITDPFQVRELIRHVSSNTGTRGVALSAIVDVMPDDALMQLADAAVKDGITDEYEFALYVVENNSTRSGANPAATAAEKSAKRKPVVADTTPQHAFVGANANIILERLITHSYAASLSGTTVAYVLQGDSASGKSHALAELKCRGERLGMAMTIMNLTQDKSASVIMNTPTVYLIDDIDKYIEYPQYESLFNQLLLSKTATFIGTCTNIRKLEKFISQHSISVAQLGSYTQTEQIAILSSIWTKGFSLIPECASLVLSLLSTFGSKMLMRDALTARQYLLYPVLHHLLGKTSQGGPISFGTYDIRKAVAQALGKNLDVETYHSLEYIEQRLATVIKGQQSVLQGVSPAIQVFLTGAYDPNRPASVMLFYGPSGVGKTELAHTIADQFADGVFHIENMSEYMEKHTISRFTGSPPGYLGYNEVPAILQYLDMHNRGVLLLDEIEKAHPDVTTFLMQLFDTGSITDGAGRVHYARGWIIIMTSNLTVEKAHSASIGFTSAAPVLVDSSERTEISTCAFFRPEVLNRIGSIHKFLPFTEQEREMVARALLTRACHILTARGITVDIEPFVADTLARFDVHQGARAMRSYIDMTVIPKLLKQTMERTHDAAFNA